MMTSTGKLLSVILVLLSHQLSDGFVSNTSPTQTFGTMISKTEPFVHTSSTCLWGISSPDHPDPNEKDDGSVSSSKETQEEESPRKEVFQFMSTALDLIGSISIVVIGGGSTLGFILNLCGYGYILPSTLEDGFKIKIGKMEDIRAELQFSRMAVSDTVSSTMSSSSSSMNDILYSQIK